MVTDNNVDGIIFSKDVNYSYNVRNKCSEQRVYIDYASSLKDLILYLIRHDSGFVFIDYKYFSHISVFTEYICSEKSSNFTFIMLTDNKVIDCVLENKFYISNLNSLTDLVFRLKCINGADNSLFNLSKGEIYKNIITYLERYGISPKHIGYSYIKECVAIGVENTSGILNYSNNIYPIIATRYHTCTGNVDKNIRTAIKKAYEHNPTIFEDDDITNRALTNAGFLNYIIEKVKIKCIEGVD